MRLCHRSIHQRILHLGPNIITTNFDPHSHYPITINSDHPIKRYCISTKLSFCTINHCSRPSELITISTHKCHHPHLYPINCHNPCINCQHHPSPSFTINIDSNPHHLITINSCLTINFDCVNPNQLPNNLDPNISCFGSSQLIDIGANFSYHPHSYPNHCLCSTINCQEHPTPSFTINIGSNPHHLITINCDITINFDCINPNQLPSNLDPNISRFGSSQLIDIGANFSYHPHSYPNNCLCPTLNHLSVTTNLFTNTSPRRVPIRRQLFLTTINPKLGMRRKKEQFFIFHRKVMIDVVCSILFIATFYSK